VKNTVAALKFVCLPVYGIEKMVLQSADKCLRYGRIFNDRFIANICQVLIKFITRQAK